MDKKLLEYFNGDELAANVWKSKYAAEGETTPDDMHKRLAKEFARVDEKYHEDEEEFFVNGMYKKLSLYGQERDYLTKENIYKLFKDFKYIVPQGSVMATLGTDTIASLSNCWVVESPLDSYSGIHKTDGDLIYYYKRRGGVGVDISKLRPEGTKTKNSAKTSTGAVSFMHRFSNTTREVAMNGRRGALMQSIDINHPDVMEFIKVKRDGTSVTGANISVRLNNEFMKAVENDEDYILRFPCHRTNFFGNVDYKDLPYNELTTDGIGYIKRIKAKEYWDEIIKSAKNYAEPGLMFWDNVLENDPAAVYDKYKPITSNPCGEQFLNSEDSCRLTAMNLYSFVNKPFTKEAEIDYKKLYEVSYEHCRLGDDLVDLELKYIQRIIDKIKSDPEPDKIKRQELELWENSYKKAQEGRRVGLGITALSDMLAALGLKYDSDEALKITDKVMYTKMEAELDCIIDLAILRGTFDGWQKELEFLTDADNELCSGTNNFYHNLLIKFPEQAKRMYKYGRRSVNWSTIAPTGSVSILTQTSSGCEPLFQPFYMRRKKINPGEAGVRVDFVDEVGDSWQEFPVLHPRFKDWMIGYIGLHGGYSVSDYSERELQKLFEKSPWYKATANDIDWQRRNEIQAILQRYTTNAISSTINLPSTVTEEEVSKIYFDGWKLGLKGTTVYVDGSRSGVLVNKSNSKKKEFKSFDAPKRPKSLPCEIHTTVSRGTKWNVIVGLFDNKPYEVFAVPYFTTKTDNMSLVKINRGRYDLYENEEVFSEDITSEMNSEQEVVTRLISTALRHGADIKFIVEQLNKSHGDITSFNKAISRTIKKYIPDGAKSTVSCNDCGSNNVIFEEGCNKCLDCGSSKCG